MKLFLLALALTAACVGTAFAMPVGNPAEQLHYAYVVCCAIMLASWSFAIALDRFDFDEPRIAE